MSLLNNSILSTIKTTENPWTFDSKSSDYPPTTSPSTPYLEIDELDYDLNWFVIFKRLGIHHKSFLDWDRSFCFWYQPLRLNSYLNLHLFLVFQEVILQLSLLIHFNWFTVFLRVYFVGKDCKDFRVSFAHALQFVWLYALIND